MIYLTVRERVERATKARLASISVANGYATNIVGVVRGRSYPRKKDDAFKIFQWFGNYTVPIRDANSLDDELVAAAFIFALPIRNDPEATVASLNACAGDVKKALQTDGSHFIPYPTTATPNCRRIRIELREGEAEFDADLRHEVAVAWIIATVRFSYIRNDPTLWDSDDVPEAA